MISCYEIASEDRLPNKGKKRKAIPNKMVSTPFKISCVQSKPRTAGLNIVHRSMLHDVLRDSQ